MANDKEDETDSGVPEAPMLEETENPVSDEAEGQVAADLSESESEESEGTESESTESESTASESTASESADSAVQEVADAESESADPEQELSESAPEDDVDSGLASDSSANDLAPEEDADAVIDTVMEGQGENSDRIEIEGGGSISDGTVNLKINGVDVGPLTHIKQILESTSQQIDNARKLIYVTSGITGFVLVISILFYIVLSMQLSQKTDELDRVIIAVAKRGIQLGDGIEKLVGVQDQLLSIEGQQSLIISDLEMLKLNTQKHSKDLSGLGTVIGGEIQAKGDEIMEFSESQKAIVLGELKTLGEMKNQLAVLKNVENNQKAIRKNLLDDKSVAADIQQKVSDLYIIRKAELAESYKLTENYNK